MIEVMCTQVGVGALVIAYTIVGAFIFQAIESAEIQQISKVTNRVQLRPNEFADELRNNTISGLWNLTSKYNTLNKRRWTEGVQSLLQNHQETMAELVLNHGYNALTPEEQWSFPAALMFTLR